MADITGALDKQKAFFATGATKEVGWRCEQIKKLCTSIQAASDRISAAQAADGVATAHFAGSAGMLMGAMGYYLSQIGKWAAPKVLDDTLPAERRGGIECEWLRVMEPKGVVLNIAPWNAPVLLSVLPVVGALAAGNCCVIKPPEAAPESSALLAEIIAASLAPEAVTVVQGDAAVCERLIDAGFDHIMFTGGTAIGKLVMARAAKTLTPVTLELGGKNPVLIDSMDAGFLAAAVKEIVGTKVYFAGEFCQCHDYCLVVDSMWDAFTAALSAEIGSLGERRSVRLINQRHYERCKRMLLEHSGTTLPADGPSPDDAALKLPVSAVLEPAASDPMMVDEIFGPLWGVLRVPDVQTAIARGAHHPARPSACAPCVRGTASPTRVRLTTLAPPPRSQRDGDRQAARVLLLRPVGGKRGRVAARHELGLPGDQRGADAHAVQLQRGHPRRGQLGAR
jgi:aldehyde dehydrogenase (NAD+)